MFFATRLSRPASLTAATLSLAALAAGAPASAGTINWIGADSAPFITGTNWQGGVVPGANDAVVNTSANAITYQNGSGATSIASLTNSSAALNIDLGTLQGSLANAASVFNIGTGKINLTRGGTGYGGTLANATVTGGTGALISLGTYSASYFTNGIPSLSGIVTSVNIDMTQTYHARATIQNGLTLKNGAGLTVTNGGGILFSGNQTISAGTGGGYLHLGDSNDAGHLLVNDNSTLTIGSGITIDGSSFDLVAGYTQTNTSNLTLNGAISDTSRGSIHVGGVFTLGTGATITAGTSGDIALSAGTLINNGTISATGGGITLYAGSYSKLGTITASNGSNIRLSGGGANGITIGAGDSLSGAFTLATLLNATGQTFDLSNGSGFGLTLDSGATVLGATFSKVAPSLTGIGMAFLDGVTLNGTSGGLFISEAGASAANGVVIRNGLTHAAGQQYIISAFGTLAFEGASSTFDNARLSTYSTSSSQPSLLTTSTANGALTLGSGLQVSVLGYTGIGSNYDRSTLTPTNTIVNNGSIQVYSGGHLTVGSLDFQNNGTLTIINGGTAQLGTNTIVNGTPRPITNTGTITLNGTKGGSSVDLSVPQGITQTAGSMFLNGSLFGDVSLQGGTLQGTGTVVGNVTNSGGLLSTGGGSNSNETSLNITSNYSQGSGGTLKTTYYNGGHNGLLYTYGPLSLSGILDVEWTLGTGGSPVVGNSYTFLTWTGTRTGAFTSIISTQTNLGLLVNYYDQNHNAAISFISPNQTNSGTISASSSSSANVTESPQTFNNTGTVSAAAGGTITISPTSGQASANSGSISAAAGGTLNFSSGLTQSAGNTNVGGSLNLGAGGSGTFNLNGGTLTGSGGTINGTVNVNSGGTINPGNSPGSMTISGNFNLAGGTQTVELGGYGQGTTYDYLDVTGTATLNGTLSISLYNGFVPNNGDTFYFFDYGSESGNYTSTTGPSGYVWSLTNGITDPNTGLMGSRLTLVSGGGATAAPEPETGTLMAGALGMLGMLGLPTLTAPSRRRRVSAWVRGGFGRG